MPRFVFRFDAVRGVREHERDACRLMLAEAQAAEAELRRRQVDAERVRERQLAEMRGLLAGGRVDVDGSAARRYHAGQISGEIRVLEQQLEIARRRVAACREALVKADQKVQALDNLRDRQWGEFQQEQERREAREREENWLARHALEERRS